MIIQLTILKSIPCTGYTISLISLVIRNFIDMNIIWIHVLLNLNQEKKTHKNSRKHLDELFWTKFYFDNYLISGNTMPEWCTMTNFSPLTPHYIRMHLCLPLLIYNEKFILNWEVFINMAFFPPRQIKSGLQYLY